MFGWVWRCGCLLQIMVIFMPKWGSESLQPTGLWCIERVFELAMLDGRCFKLGMVMMHLRTLAYVYIHIYSHMHIHTLVAWGQILSVGFLHRLLVIQGGQGCLSVRLVAQLLVNWSPGSIPRSQGTTSHKDWDGTWPASVGMGQMICCQLVTNSIYLMNVGHIIWARQLIQYTYYA